MNDTSLNRVGGACSIALGVSYIAVTIFFVLDRTKFVKDSAELWPKLAENGTPRVLYYWGYAIGAVFAFGAIPAIAALVRRYNEGWVRWTTGLAYLSFAVTAVETFRLVRATPLWADTYVTGDQAARTAIVSTDLLLRLDPDTWLRFGVLGPWVLVVTILARRHGVLPRVLGYTGYVLGVLTITTALGVATGFGPMVLVSALLGGALAAPIWFIWVGIVLRRGAGAPATAPAAKEAQHA